MNALLKIGTLLLLVFAIAMAAMEYVQQQDEETARDEKRLAAEKADATTIERSDPETLDAENIVGKDPREVVSLAAGIIGPVPAISELPVIDEIPWRAGIANQMYANSRGRRCELLLPGIPVTSGLAVRPGRATTIGRIPALSIELELQEEAKSKMAKITRTQTEKYLREHRLVIEPILYHDDRDRVYFGTDCRAAFFEKDRPLVTTKAEPMIAESVGKFLSMGLFSNGEKTDGRTLLMAFRYVSTDKLMTGVSKPQMTTELLILHLRPDATPQNPRFDMFATIDGRETIHRLESSETLLTDPVTTIKAEIKFGRFVMMGLYPASPMVTGIQLRSARSMPTARLRLMMNQRQGVAPTLPELLDRFDELVDESNASEKMLGRPGT